MKTLTQTLCPPPVLDQYQHDAMVEQINHFLEKYTKDRQYRVEKLDQIRKMHEDDYKHREKTGSIFSMSNVGVPLMKGVALSLASKIEDELFANETPFYAEPQGAEDKREAEKFSRYWRWELMDKMRYRDSGSESLSILTVEGTAITKRTWRTDRSYYKRRDRVLFDQQGMEVLGPNGEPIRPDTEVEVLEDSTGQIDRHYLFNGVRGVRLSHEQVFAEKNTLDFVTHYDNANIQVLPFSDFLCDIMVDRIERSALLSHEYELHLYEIWEKLFQMVERLDSLEGFRETGWILENVRKLQDLETNEAKEDKGGSNQKDRTAQLLAPRERFGERRWDVMGLGKPEKIYNKVQLSEIYFKYDLDKDGTPEDLVVLFDKKQQNILWVNSLVNVYSDCKPPFVAHGLYRVPGRWWSMGPYELLSMAQEFTDKVWNRMNYRASMSANPMGWYKPENFVKPPKQWGPGERVQLKKNEVIANSMGFIAMPSMEGVEWTHFQFFLNLIQLITGVSNAAQGDIAGLPSMATATGITSIIEEGNKMYRMLIRRLQDSFSEEILGIVRLIQQNLDSARVFRYDKGADEIVARVSPEDLRELDFDVRIVLAKHGSLQKTQMVQSALTVIQQYLTIPTEHQQRLRKVYLQLLTSIGLQEADDILPTDEELSQENDKDAVLNQIAQQISDAAVKVQGGNLDPSKTVATDLLGIANALTQLAARPPVPAPGGPPQQATEIPRGSPGIQGGPSGFPEIPAGPGSQQNVSTTPTPE